jgi:hypothetical protein
MTVGGSWKVTLSTPVGPQVIRLRIDPQGEGFTGRIDGPMGANDVAGKISGNTLSWIMDVKKPIPVKVTFHATIDGDRMSGFAKAGLFGKAALSGERLGEEADRGMQAAAAGPVTADSVDPQFAEPYIELNELRQQPAPHRYVHGGFMGTDARFSFYFPPKDRYQGRFFHNTYPLALSADVGPFPIAFDVATGDLGFSFDSGAYYVQTNLGGADGRPPADPTIAAYRVNAAAAKYSRQVAAELYGPHRPFGYLFGGSGGSYQTIGAAENTQGVWDGFVPFVMATPNAIPSMFTVRMHALRLLRHRLAGIFDAIDAGGSGDPYEGLNEEEREALREVTRMGFPPRGWWEHETMDSGYFSKVAGIVPMIDPDYLADFWSKPGYLGSDPANAIHAERFRFETRVVAVQDGLQKQVELESIPEHSIADAHLVLADGRSVPMAEIEGRKANLSISADPSVAASIRAGDRVRIDNAWPLALQTYQRHQVPESGMAGWDQYRDADGKPLYPQRELLVGPVGAGATAGSVPEGDIHGKMLVLQCLMDIDAMPWQADWYRGRVKEKLGAGFEEQFALWYIDRAQHDNPQDALARCHVVNFSGALQQALRDVSAWVEQGVKPAQTRYQVKDAQVIVPETAAERGGVQPVVRLSAAAAAKAGEAVSFCARIEVPAGAGKIVAAEWDFEGAGDFRQAEPIGSPQALLELSRNHIYEKPGTYFAMLRVVSQREGDMRTPYGRIQNLARVRIIVR